MENVLLDGHVQILPSSRWRLLTSIAISEMPKSHILANGKGMAG